LARRAVVLFLARYKDNSGLDDKAFFSCFSLALYDFLETRKEENRYPEIRKKYQELIEDLEKAALETTQVNRHENSHLTHKLLQESLAGKYENFCKELTPFLQVFIWDYQKQYLNTPKH
jgi:hypothetical protein